MVRFLRGLNEQYSNVRPQIMLMRPFPDIDTVSSMLTLQERQMTSEVHDPVALFNTSVRSKISGSGSRGRGLGRGTRGQSSSLGGRGSNGKGQSTKVCTRIDMCYKKQGYPPSMKNNRSVNNYTSDEHVITTP